MNLAAHGVPIFGIAPRFANAGWGKMLAAVLKFPALEKSFRQRDDRSSCGRQEFQGPPRTARIVRR
jgi:hypothetical protein